MNNPADSAKQSYQSLYEDFDSPLMSQLRREAYGEDIGQHSWVTAEDLRRDASRLILTRGSRLLDLGCGPCGPLTFLMKATDCSGIGLDLSGAALAVGCRRAQSLGLDDRLTVYETDLDSALPVAAGTVDAAISLDVVLHLRDRLRTFTDIARVLVKGGRFLFTDAGVLTGAISSEEVATRSMHGFTQFCAPAFNERTLEQAGLTLLETEDRTHGILNNARGRLEARFRRQADFEQLEGAEGFARYQGYLQSIVSMSERGTLSRVMYLAELRSTIQPCRG
jgi:cyclopropane fatty-acyl-phospholipid synthase-like methyltransferase